MKCDCKTGGYYKDEIWFDGSTNYMRLDTRIKSESDFFIAISVNTGGENKSCRITYGKVYTGINGITEITKEEFETHLNYVKDKIGN